MPVMTVGTGRVLLGGARHWWEAGGADGCLVAYQPKGANDYAASKVNLANPGTFDATEGAAPGWSTAGWLFNGGSHYLRTGVVVAQTSSTMLVQFAGFAGGSANTIAGAYTNGVSAFLIQSATSAIRSHNGLSADNAPMLASGNLAISGNRPYRNGAVEANAIPGGGTVPLVEIFVGALNLSGAPSQYAAVTVAAFAFYNNALTSMQIAAVSIRMAAL